MADGTRGAMRTEATLGPDTSQTRDPDDLLVAGMLQGLVAAAPEAAGGLSFVNPKQSGRILKRRRARLKFSTMQKTTRARADYAYESRHRHACNRKRDANGRFPARAKKAAEAPAAAAPAAAAAPTAAAAPAPAPVAVAPALAVAATVASV
jgi:hypothetical protein